MLRNRIPRIALLNKAVIGGGGIPDYKYHPYHLELQKIQELEEKTKKAKINLKKTEVKIENLEAERLMDLANQAKQKELIILLKKQKELEQFIQKLEQQKLKLIKDDEDFLSVLMYIV